ncbi:MULTISPECIES: hypothetical protein [unclassified Rhodococcus (in: high G+C Gram-positive bacteria)]|uniref:hypothetical protein n=2 Tax=Rhodococcus TaxID=1827 RepID=UPI0024B6B0C3|nr:MULTISPECIES: hypothetical protein [unclassified Rhodococcus (in: high G+C Gram-positive bacteria)]
MLRDLDSGNFREVDTCIESVTAGHPVIVSIECRAHKRPQTVSWVEEMHSKHLRLPTNVLVLVSSSGFTRSAIEKARQFGITTAVPGEIEPGRFGTEVVGKLDAIWMKSFTLTVGKVRLWVEESADRPAEIVVPFLDTSLFFEDGDFAMSAQDLAQGFMSSVDLENDAMRDALGDEEFFTIGRDPATAIEPESGEAVDLYLKKEEPTGNYLRKITRIEITGSAEVTVAEIPLTHRELNGTGYSAGAAKLGDRAVLVVATETPSGETSLTARFDAP